LSNSLRLQPHILPTSGQQKATQQGRAEECEARLRADLEDVLRLVLAIRQLATRPVEPVTIGPCRKR